MQQPEGMSFEIRTNNGVLSIAIGNTYNGLGFSGMSDGKEITGKLVKYNEKENSAMLQDETEMIHAVIPASLSAPLTACEPHVAPGFKRGITMPQFDAIEAEAKGIDGYSEAFWDQLVNKLSANKQIWSEDYYVANLLPDQADLVQSMSKYVKAWSDQPTKLAFMDGANEVISKIFTNAKNLGFHSANEIISPPQPQPGEHLPFVYCIAVRTFVGDCIPEGVFVIGVMNPMDINLSDSFLFSQFILQHMDEDTIKTLEMVELILYSNENNKLTLPGWLLTNNRLHFNGGKLARASECEVPLVRNEFAETDTSNRYVVFKRNEAVKDGHQKTVDAAWDIARKVIANLSKGDNYEEVAVHVMNSFSQLIGFYYYCKKTDTFQYIRYSQLRDFSFRQKLKGRWLMFRWTNAYKYLQRAVMWYIAPACWIVGLIFPVRYWLSIGIAETSILMVKGILQKEFLTLVNRDFHHFVFLSTFLYALVYYLFLT